MTKSEIIKKVVDALKAWGAEQECVCDCIEEGGQCLYCDTLEALELAKASDLGVEYVIKDDTANTGRHYIGEDTKNCAEELAKVFESGEEAFLWLDDMARRGASGFHNYEVWASVQVKE